MLQPKPLEHPCILVVYDVAVNAKLDFVIRPIHETPKPLAVQTHHLLPLSKTLSYPPTISTSPDSVSTTPVSSLRRGLSPPSIGGKLSTRRHSFGVSAPRSTIATIANFVCIEANVSDVASKTILLPCPRSRRVNSLRVNSSLIC